MLTGDIPPHDRLERYDLCFLNKYRTAFQLFPMLMHLRHLFDPGSHDMVRDDMLQLIKPEERQFRKDSALVWNALALRVRQTGSTTGERR